MPPRNSITVPEKTYTDFIQPFLMDHSSIRGRLVRLNKVLDNILGAHNYPLPVSVHLAEQLVLTALLSATLAEQDIVTVQAKGDGPVRFMVTDAMAGGTMRGYAAISEEALNQALGQAESARLLDLMGKGYLAVTLDSGKENQRYQGIVELAGNTFSEALEAYFKQSQQAEMLVHVSVKPPEKKIKGKAGKGWHAGGIIIERMPVEGGTKEELSREEQDDLWLRTGFFMQTLKDSEMLDENVTPQNLLYRLFSEDGVWVYKLQPLKSGCRCSRARVSAVLKSLPEAELLSTLEDDKLTVHCEFCNKREVFTDAQIKRLYKAHAPKNPK